MQKNGKETTSNDVDGAVVNPTRRRLVGAVAAGAALTTLGAPAIVRAQSATPIRVGYWPLSAGLPFYAAIEKGIFKDAGLNVVPLKFASAQEVVEAMLSGRADGSVNGVGSANLAIGEIAEPGLVRIFATNPSNVDHVLDEVIVPINSPAKTIADLKGKRVASGPGIQNVTLARTILERGGAAGTNVIELPIGQHVASLAAGQIDAVYTLEPTGTVGRMNGTTRNLEVGVISKYVLGDPQGLAWWHGGAASLTGEFMKKNPELSKQYIAAYTRGIEYVRSSPDDARQYMKGYTAIAGPLTAQVPITAYMLHNEFKPKDIADFQKFYDLFSDKKIFSERLLVDTMIYKA